MRGSPTNSFLAERVRHTAEVLKLERRPRAAKWLKIAADRLELLDFQVRNERARQDFLEALQDEWNKNNPSSAERLFSVQPLDGQTTRHTSA